MAFTAASHAPLPVAWSDAHMVMMMPGEGIIEGVERVRKG